MSNLRIYMDLHVWRGNPAADTTDSVSRWWCEDWQLATVINSSLVDDPTV